jgi:hypothetical protein
MGWWFGRKAAPADARPFVPAWLHNDAAEEGFARSSDGMALYVRASGLCATYRAGAWEIGAVRGSSLVIGDEQVVGTRQAAISSPTGGSTVDAEARTALGAVLAALRTHGLIES